MAGKSKLIGRQAPAFGETWRHFKGGEYTILGIAKSTTDPGGNTLLNFARHSEGLGNVLVFGPMPDQRDPSIGFGSAAALREAGQSGKLLYLIAKGDTPGVLVLYHRRPLDPVSDLWARPLDNFLSEAGKGEAPDGPRFERLTDSEGSESPASSSPAGK